MESGQFHFLSRISINAGELQDGKKIAAHKKIFLPKPANLSLIFQDVQIIMPVLKLALYRYFTGVDF
jgi:hypothetical protein